MENIKNILDRLRTVYKAPNNRQLAEKLGINYNTLSTWVKRESIPYEILHSYVHNENISFDWLLSGKGSMYLDEKTSNHTLTNTNGIQIANNGNVNGNISISINKDDFKDDSEDIKKLVGLLKFAPKSFIHQIIERLEKFKELSQI